MSLGDELRDAAAGDEDFDPPNGAYTARLIDGGAFTARTDAKRYVKLRWQIVGTDLAGRQFEDFGGIDNPVGKRITAEKLTMLGVDFDKVADIEDLDHAIFNVLGAIAEVSVGHTGTFRNVSVTSVRTDVSDIPADQLVMPAMPPTPQAPKQQSFAAAAGRDDDDIPF